MTNRAGKNGERREAERRQKERERELNERFARGCFLYGENVPEVDMLQNARLSGGDFGCEKKDLPPSFLCNDNARYPANDVWLFKSKPRGGDGLCGLAALLGLGRPVRCVNSYGHPILYSVSNGSVVELKSYGFCGEDAEVKQIFLFQFDVRDEETAK